MAVPMASKPALEARRSKSTSSTDSLDSTEASRLLCCGLHPWQPCPLAHMSLSEQCLRLRRRPTLSQTIKMWLRFRCKLCQNHEHEQRQRGRDGCKHAWLHICGEDRQLRVMFQQQSWHKLLVQQGLGCSYSLLLQSQGCIWC